MKVVNFFDSKKFTTFVLRNENYKKLIRKMTKEELMQSPALQDELGNDEE